MADDLINFADYAFGKQGFEGAGQLRDVAPALDYCECGRGPVVGLLTYTDSRVFFRVAAEGTPWRDQEAADLRCLDCVVDAVRDVASGEVRERMRESVRTEEIA